ncbi:elongation of very long chain fatty acids protein, partial [Asbolus verrucosus]
MDRFLLESPLQPIAVSFLYLVFIYKIGPKLMENRKPFDLRKIIIAYNISQIVTNVVLFKMFFNVAPHLNILCSPSADLSNNSTATLMLKPHYYYTLLKYYDLTETIFFVLRKKRRQISYLHVHHHIGMLAAAWISCKYFPGGQALYVGLYNTFVHTVMYCYYLLTAWNSDYGRGAWWKKYITLMQ